MKEHSAKRSGKGTTVVQKKEPKRKAASTGRESTFRYQGAVYLLLILLLTLIVFYKGIDNGFVNWDDDSYLHNNPQIKELNLNSIKTIFKEPYFANYHPLTTLTYALEYSLYKLSPRPYHLFNIILHLLNTLLVYFFIKGLTNKQDVSLLTALLFAVHPMHVESAAWISERKDVLYSLFYLSALISYVHYLKTGEKLKHLIVTLLLFTASLLSKSAAVTLPLVMGLTLYYIKPKAGLKPLLYLLPFFILSLVFGIVALQTQEDAIGSVDINSIYSIPERILVVFYAVYFYVIKFIYPSGLAAMHPFPIEGMWGIPAGFYFSPLLVIILSVLVVLAKGTLKRLLIYGFLFFLASIALNIQIIPVGDAIVQERYTYLPYIGFALIVSQLLTDYLIPKYKYIAIGLTGVYIFFLSYTAYTQVRVWRDSETLWTHSIGVNGRCHISYYSRGAARADKGDYKGAKEDFETSLAINPDYAPAYNNRGVIRISEGDTQGALKDYEKAISLQPNYPKAYNNLGHALAISGKADEALVQINKAIALSPNYVEAYSNRGNIYFFKQQYDSAIVNYKKALSLDSGYMKAYENMASVYFNKGSYKEAIGYYTIILEKQPQNAVALSFRGRSYILSGDTAMACSDWERAAGLGHVQAGVWYEGVCSNLTRGL